MADLIDSEGCKMPVDGEGKKIMTAQISANSEGAEIVVHMPEYIKGGHWEGGDNLTWVEYHSLGLLIAPFDQMVDEFIEKFNFDSYSDEEINALLVSLQRATDLIQKKLKMEEVQNG